MRRGYKEEDEAADDEDQGRGSLGGASSNGRPSS